MALTIKRLLSSSVVRYGAASLIPRGLAIVTALVVTPLGVDRLGLVGFGIWVLATQLPNILIAPDLGLGNGAVNELSSIHLRDGNLVTQYRRLVGLTKLLSAVAVLWVIVGTVGSVLYVYGQPSDVRSRLLLALFAGLVCFVSSLPTVGWLRAQLAQERGYLGVLWEGVGKAISLVLCVAVLLWTPDPILLVVAYLLPSSASLCANALVYVRREFAGHPPQASVSVREAFNDNRHLFRQGRKFITLQLCYVATVGIDPYLVGSALSAADVGYLNVVRRPFDLLPLVVSLYSIALWPVFARMHSQAQYRRLRWFVLGFSGSGGALVALGGISIVLAATPVYQYLGQGDVLPQRSDLMWATLSASGAAVLLILTSYLYAVSAIQSQVRIMIIATVAILPTKLFVLSSTGNVHDFIAWSALMYAAFVAIPMTILAVLRLRLPASASHGGAR